MNKKNCKQNEERIEIKHMKNKMSDIQVGCLNYNSYFVKSDSLHFLLGIFRCYYVSHDFIVS